MTVTMAQAINVAARAERSEHGRRREVAARAERSEHGRRFACTAQEVVR